MLEFFRESGALLEGHFRLSSGLHSRGYLQCALVLQHPAHAETLGRALAAVLLRALSADGRALAGARRAHHRPRSGARARRARDLRGTSGRRAHAAPRLHARRRPIASSSSRTWSRPADRRARRWRWRARRARRSSAPARSSIAAAARRISACRSTRSSTLSLADLSAGRVPDVRGGTAGHEARIAAVQDASRSSTSTTRGTVNYAPRACAALRPAVSFDL